MSDQIMDLYNEKLRRMGVLDADPAPVVQPSRRVEQPVVPVQAVQSVQYVEKFEPAVVRDARVDELEARIAHLEKVLAPALAQPAAAEIDKMYLEFLSLEGKTELTWHQFRCLPRVKRQELLAGAA